jgi:LuxR family maltose regulon positive regulatory protein
MRVRVHLASGDREAASGWADQVLQSDEYQKHKEHYRLTLARIRLAQGRFSDVEEILSGIPDTSFQGNRITRQIESNTLLATSLLGQQRDLEAMKLITNSLALAEPEGYIRVFVDLGESVRDALAAYLRSASPIQIEHARKVLHAFSQTGKLAETGSQSQGLIEPLSVREEEVLQLMAQGKTNQEIAGHLFVARGTIKAHAANIFRKLDAANRTEAVTRARQLKIIP